MSSMKAAKNGAHQRYRPEGIVPEEPEARHVGSILK